MPTHYHLWTQNFNIADSEAVIETYSAYNLFFFQEMSGQLLYGSIRRLRNRYQLSNALQFRICMFLLHQLDFLFYFWIQENLILGKRTFQVQVSK